MKKEFNCRPLDFGFIEDINFSSVLNEIKNYRPGYKLEKQVEEYKHLLLQVIKYSQNPTRARAKIQLVRLLENNFKTIIN
jgi:hypothetical protein